MSGDDSQLVGALAEQDRGGRRHWVPVRPADEKRPWLLVDEGSYQYRVV